MPPCAMVMSPAYITAAPHNIQILPTTLGSFLHGARIMETSVQPLVE